ncbi:HAD family hydrolase [Planctomonas deserti]|uniref:HAD family hydrolase n=1 Tax=Planctomonas deserti TaxID=2144185 RepID=UPI000D3D0EE7|nr:HAD family hydrolase [Planctomonas deserti]
MSSDTIPAVRHDRLLIALDLDGTVLGMDGTLSDAVTEEVQRVSGLGHEVMVATGRSVADALPILTQLGVSPEYVVCSNGAITMHRDPSSPEGYRRRFVETFDPTDVLQRIRPYLASGRYAVEDEDGHYLYSGGEFPDGFLEAKGTQVEFEELLHRDATRVVVISPGHDMEDFLAVVERMGLHRVTYAIGWTAWLDIAPDGVNKATALERVRRLLDIPLERVVVAGDGRNDIDMFEWAREHGRAIAMGQAPQEVLAASSEVTAPVTSDGLAAALRTIEH